MEFPTGVLHHPQPRYPVHRFNPSFNGIPNGIQTTVPIVYNPDGSFNPSFNGIPNGSIVAILQDLPSEAGFNPSFNGIPNGRR